MPSSRSSIHKKQENYSNVTHIYTLDQCNENSPYSGDMNYLSNVTHGTWQNMKAADPQAIWMMQGRPFYSDSTSWSYQRVQA